MKKETDLYVERTGKSSVHIKGGLFFVLDEKMNSMVYKSERIHVGKQTIGQVWAEKSLEVIYRNMTSVQKYNKRHGSFLDN